MLGHDLLKKLGADERIRCYGYTREQVDITNPSSVAQAVAGAEVVYNCAAYTAVDLAEEESEKAYLVNAEGAGLVAECAKEAGARLFHTSTDYVFDGTKQQPYIESDATNPLNVYGTSKLAGEKAVEAVGGDYAIIRLQALFGISGPNFIEAILRQLHGDSPQLKVVGDQITVPSYTGHVSQAMAAMLTVPYTGILNVCATGSCSWFDFAKSISEQAGIEKSIVEVDSNAFPRPAKRPMHSVLNGQRCHELLNKEMPSWEQGLVAYLNEKEML